MSAAPAPGWNLSFAAFLVAATATLGSLFLSEVMQQVPCSLCWVQRIFMFPLPILLLVGLLPYDPRVGRYALPLALGGLGVAIWHTLLYVGVLPESLAPCRQGVPCTQPTFALFGLLSIPVMSLLAFSLLTLLLVLQRQRVRP